MAVGKRKTGRAAMIGGGDVVDLKLTGVEEASIVDAIGMFIQENPGFSSAVIMEIAGLLSMKIHGAIPRGGTFGISNPDTDVARKAADALSPALRPLHRGHKTVCGTSKNVFRFGDVRSQPGILLIDQEIEIRVVSADGPIQPTLDPARAVHRVASPAFGLAAVQCRGDIIAVVMVVHLPANH